MSDEMKTLSPELKKLDSTVRDCIEAFKLKYGDSQNDEIKLALSLADQKLLETDLTQARMLFVQEAITQTKAFRGIRKGIRTRALPIIELSDEKLFAIDSTGTAYPLTYDQSTGKYRIRVTSIAFFDSNDTPLFDILLKGETYKALGDFSPVYSTNENAYFQGDSQFQMITRQSKTQTQYRLFLDQAVLEYPTNETAIDQVNMMSNEGLIHFPRDLKDRSLVSDPSRPWLDSYTL